MFPALVVDHVIRAELGQTQEAGPIERLHSVAAAHQRTQRQTREVVARQESGAGEVAVGVVVTLRHTALVAQELHLALRLGFLPFSGTTLLFCFLCL